MLSLQKKLLNHLSDFPYSQVPKDYQNLVEIYDNRGEKIMIMPLELAKKKKMLHKIVFIILKDKNNRVLLSKKIEQGKVNSLWSLSGYNAVFLGQSTLGTAIEELKNNYFIEDIKIKEIHTLPFMENDVPLSATIYSAGPWWNSLRINSNYVADAMFVDKDELSGLLEIQPEMFSSLLIWALRSNLIF